ncbi:hypothetical protein TNCV_1081141 [Trichonephila clavipes]|uniref:Uncharacterized protein n=1 Tax=Trichonephila clavipes TaxID=2585209 RepID=A0A8X6RS02_TRICX|nr:hypothetical protein TNCV_1081141 [Trichonephila clavipes]
MPSFSLPSNQPAPSLQPAKQEARSPQPSSATFRRTHLLLNYEMEDCLVIHVITRVSFQEIIRFLYFSIPGNYTWFRDFQESHEASIIYEVVIFDLTVDFNLGHR